MNGARKARFTPEFVWRLFKDELAEEILQRWPEGKNELTLDEFLEVPGIDPVTAIYFVYALDGGDSLGSGLRSVYTYEAVALSLISGMLDLDDMPLQIRVLTSLTGRKIQHLLADTPKWEDAAHAAIVEVLKAAVASYESTPVEVQADQEV